MNKKLISRKTAVSKRSKKYQSHLVTEITTHTDSERFAAFTKDAFDNEILVREVKDRALSFLDQHRIPYSELLLGEQGVVSLEWLDQFDHIPGVRTAFSILLELHCFEMTCKDKPTQAYAHLLRIIPKESQLVTAEMEARFYAGAARSGDGGRKTERNERKNRLFCEYCNLRNDGKSPIHARQFSAKRLGISMTTAKRYFTIEKIEKLYQQIT